MKTAVIFWSGTGNTEAMANAVAEGAGVQATAVGSFDSDLSGYEAIALGCPAMGAEGLRTASLSRSTQQMKQSSQASLLRCSALTTGATANGCAFGQTRQRQQAQRSLTARVLSATTRLMTKRLQSAEPWAKSSQRAVKPGSSFYYP